MNKRVLVLTGSDNDAFKLCGDTDAKIAEISEMTSTSKQKFAKKNGYDFMFLRSFGKDRNNIFSEKHIGQLRFLRTIEMLKDYDAVFWIDADSLITNLDYKLEDFMDENHCFVASWDWMHKFSFSTGNFIVQKTPEIDKLYSIFYEVGRNLNSEQEALNAIWRANILKGMKALEHKFLGSTPTKQQYGVGWETRPEPIGPWSEDSFLVHLTGVSNINRIRILNTFFKEYL
jgi:hypothetical protein